jgi:hypothetical protein
MDYSYFRCCCVPVASHYWRRGKACRLQDRIEHHWTLIGTNTGPGGAGHRVCISGFEVWQIGADGLIASSQGHFDRSEYHRQLERGVQEPQ